MIDLSRVLEYSQVPRESSLEVVSEGYLSEYYCPRNLREAVLTLIKKRCDFTFDFVCSTPSRIDYIKRVVLLLVMWITSRRVIFKLTYTHLLYEKITRSSLRALASYVYTLPWRVALPHAAVLSGEIHSPTSSFRKIWTHALDYERLKAHKRVRTTEVRKYFLYIDQNLPFHKDIGALGYTSHYSADEFFEEIGQVLKGLEDRFGMRCIVQAHPSADINILSKYYPYEVRSGAIIDNMQGSEFVVCHHSAAMDLAVLMYKPILFVGLEKYRGRNIDALGSIYRRIPKEKAQELGQTYMESFTSNQRIGSVPNALRRVDESVYSEYIHQYIKSRRSREGMAAEIIIDDLFSNEERRSGDRR